MRLSYIKHNLARAFKQKNQMQAIVLIIVLSNLLLATYLFSNQNRIVVIPAQVNNSFWTENRKVSKEYLEEMAMFFTNLLLDVSPHTMTYQRDIILRNVDATAYNQIKLKLIKEEARYKEENLATTFRPTEIIVNNIKFQVYIKGYLISYVAGKKVSENEEKYLLQFRYDANRLFIKSFEYLAKT